MKHRLSGSHSAGVATLRCVIDENNVDRCIQNKTLLICAKSRFKQGDHLTGKPGNVRDRI